MAHGSYYTHCPLTHACTHTHTQTRVRTHTQTRVRTHTHTQNNVHTYNTLFIMVIYVTMQQMGLPPQTTHGVHTHTHTHTHARTHTHTQ